VSIGISAMTVAVFDISGECLAWQNSFLMAHAATFVMNIIVFLSLFQLDSRASETFDDTQNLALIWTDRTMPRTLGFEMSRSIPPQLSHDMKPSAITLWVVIMSFVCIHVHSRGLLWAHISVSSFQVPLMVSTLALPVVSFRTYFFMAKMLNKSIIFTPSVADQFGSRSFEWRSDYIIPFEIHLCSVSNSCIYIHFQLTGNEIENVSWLHERERLDFQKDCLKPFIVRDRDRVHRSRSWIALDRTIDSDISFDVHNHSQM
jgi:hypothetical protein